MKATLKAVILSVDKDDGKVTLSIMTPAAGKVNTKSISAQDIYLNGKLILKELVANEMKLGATITITVSDED